MYARFKYVIKDEVKRNYLYVFYVKYVVSDTLNDMWNVHEKIKIYYFSSVEWSNEETFSSLVLGLRRSV